MTDQDRATVVAGDDWSLTYDPNTDELSGDPTAAAEALRAARDGQMVPIFGLFPVTASWENPVGALAALVAHQPGRAVVEQAPPDVLGWCEAKFAWLRESEDREPQH